MKFNDKVIGCVQSASFSIDVDMDEATCQDSNGAKEYTAGQTSWKGSIGALYRELTAAEQATGVSFDDAFDAIEAGAPVTLVFSKKTGGSLYTGTAFVSSLKWDQPEKGNVTWSADFQGSGALVKTV